MPRYAEASSLISLSTNLGCYDQWTISYDLVSWSKIRKEDSPASLGRAMPLNGPARYTATDPDESGDRAFAFPNRKFGDSRHSVCRVDMARIGTDVCRAHPG